MPKRRRKFKCPEESCETVVFNISRHLQQVHKKSSEQAKYTTLNQKLRLKRVYVNKTKFKTYQRRRYQCPMETCNAHVRQILQKFGNLSEWKDNKFESNCSAEEIDIEEIGETKEIGEEKQSLSTKSSETVSNLGSKRSKPEKYTSGTSKVRPVSKSGCKKKLQ